MDSKIHIFKGTEEIIECPERSIDYLNDFMLEIKGIKTIMNTEDVLKYFS